MDEEPVIIVPYDPEWPKRFAEEHTRLQEALASWLVGPIEHVGSTAVPGLAAKPIIDIMAGVCDLPSSLDARKALLPLEYIYFPYRPDVMHWFCKPTPEWRSHHLHLVPFGSKLWQERITFRDLLRSSPDVAAEYAQVKHDLAARFSLNREAYTEAKTPFIMSVLRRAEGEEKD